MKKLKNKAIEHEKEQDVLKPTKLPRKTWDAAFQEMRANDDDRLLICDVFEDENFEEWN